MLVAAAAAFSLAEFVSGPLLFRVPFPRHELAMPAEQCIGRGDGGNLVQRLTANANSPHRQAAPVGVGQTGAPSAKLPTEQPILR